METGIIAAGIPFLLMLALGIKKYTERNMLYKYYQASSDMHVTSISKCDEHLLKLGFIRIN